MPYVKHFLTDRTKERLAANYIRKGLSQNLSGAAILRTLRANDMGVREQTFYRMVNYYTTHPKQIPQASPQELKTLIPNKFIIKYPGKETNLYQYVFRVPVRLTTGEIISKKYLSVKSLHRITPDVAFHEIQQNYAAPASYGHLLWGFSTFEEVRNYRSDFPYV